MNLKHFVMLVVALLLCVSSARAQEFTVARSRVFAPQNKSILLLKDAASDRKIILFQTNLRVNTDGSSVK